ncbi:transposase family protein [Streptomyces sp. NPDC054775]
MRLHTLADVFAYARAKGVELRLDGTEVKVRRPKANKPGRRAFVSGKLRQNTKKATVISDEAGRTLWTGAIRPGRMHDQTAVRTEGIADQVGSVRGGTPPTVLRAYLRGAHERRAQAVAPTPALPRPPRVLQ